MDRTACAIEVPHKGNCCQLFQLQFDGRNEVIDIFLGAGRYSKILTGTADFVAAVSHKALLIKQQAISK